MDEASGAASDACELLLLAKDGVYLLDLPRPVGHIFLGPANRAELLVRCTGPPGTRLTLTAGRLPSPMGAGMPASSSLAQAVVATIEIQASQVWGEGLHSGQPWERPALLLSRREGPA